MEIECLSEIYSNPIFGFIIGFNWFCFVLLLTGPHEIDETD